MRIRLWIAGIVVVAGARGVDALPPHTAIGAADLEASLTKQGTTLAPGDVVLIRTGTLRHWGETGGDHATIGRHDSAGITLEAARWLVTEHGAMLVGSDTSGLEYNPAPEETKAYREKYGSFMPVHNYLLIEQGVHIGEFHNLEGLSREKACEFYYVACTNKIKGATAGFTKRPIAIR